MISRVFNLPLNSNMNFIELNKPFVVKDYKFSDIKY